MAKKKLLDCLREQMCIERKSPKTQKTYTYWIKVYIQWSNCQHPKDLGVKEVTSFLTYLAITRKVALSTQNQALNSLIYLYRFLDIELKGIDAIRSSRPRRIPVVFSQEEVKKIFSLMENKNQLIYELMYGAGLRISEVLRLRILDLDFSYSSLIVRNTKGNKDRVSILPSKLNDKIKSQIELVQEVHYEDFASGFGCNLLPDLLNKKYPNAGKELKWQYLFPATRRFKLDGQEYRYHIHESIIQKNLEKLY